MHFYRLAAIDSRHVSVHQWCARPWCDLHCTTSNKNDVLGKYHLDPSQARDCQMIFSKHSGSVIQCKLIINLLRMYLCVRARAHPLLTMYIYMNMRLHVEGRKPTNVWRWSRWTKSVRYISALACTWCLANVFHRVSINHRILLADC